MRHGSGGAPIRYCRDQQEHIHEVGTPSRSPALGTRTPVDADALRQRAAVPSGFRDLLAPASPSFAEPTAPARRTRPAARRLRVLVPDGESFLAPSVVRCLADVPRVEVHVLSSQPRAPIRFSRHVARHHVWDPDTGEPGYIDAVRRTLLATGADVLLPIDERAIATIAAAGDAFGPRVAVAALASPETFGCAADKARLAIALRHAGVPHPATISSVQYVAAGHDASPLRFPLLFKPTRGGYGRGIRRFDTPEALRAFFETPASAEPAVLQEWFDGRDIDCSVLCEDGDVLVATVQHALRGGYTAYSSPAAIEIVDDPEALGVTKAVMAALDWNGIAHVDLRLDHRDGRVKVIEINPRYWGSLGASFLAGVNFPWLACLAALGEPLPEVTIRPLRYYAGRAATWRLLEALGQRGRGVYDGRAEASGLRFVLEDPLPAVTAAVRRMVKRVRPVPQTVA
jgi:glutathione synthase/RimK-type ligase-like ATP-grasp enzyme